MTTRKRSDSLECGAIEAVQSGSSHGKQRARTDIGTFASEIFLRILRKIDTLLPEERLRLRGLTRRQDLLPPSASRQLEYDKNSFSIKIPSAVTTTTQNSKLPRTVRGDRARTTWRGMKRMLDSRFSLAVEDAG